MTDFPSPPPLPADPWKPTPPAPQITSEQPLPQKRRKGWWAVGIVGFLFFFLIGIGGCISALGLDPPEAEPAPLTDEDIDRLVAATPAPTTQPAIIQAPPTEPPKAEVPAASRTKAQENAIGSAEDYLTFLSFSRQGLIDQLIFEQFSTEDATYAADFLDVDWMAQAASSAEDYLSSGSFSCGGLIDQLIFEDYTREQAEHGANGTGIC